MSLRFSAILAFHFAASFVLFARGVPPQESDRESKTSHQEAITKSLHDQFQSLFESMTPQAKSGYRHLVDSVYLPHDFDERVLEAIDRREHWVPLQDVQLEAGTREATWLAHGLSARPDEPSKPLQYVVTDDGRYVMNCFACHGGNLFGSTFPGAPNTMYALESLTELVRSTKIEQRQPLAHMDVGSMFMPLGSSNGTSNAVMFGVALMNYRDADLNIYPNRLPAKMTHHDMDAPPWWHFHRKHHIYIDGFAEKGHKGLMQFMLVRQNGPKQFRSWESDFRDVYAFLSELRPPKYPLEIDAAVAEKGRRVFNDHCAQCHGTYANSQTPNASSDYPGRIIPIEDIGTDRVRFDALTPRHRHHYGMSWFADYGKQNTLEEVDGYVAPPLDGVWASAPYFHNGSVPTLWHVLHPEHRPARWQRIALAMDEERMGLMVEEVDRIPETLPPSEKRWIFDSTALGKSNSGHDYPNELTEEEKIQVLEYLKTL
jgi:mono/diheme cytochrome c family protein